MNPDWTSLLQVEHANEASSERNQRNLLGGYREVAGDDKDVTAAASFAAQQLSEQSNSLQPFAVQEVRTCAGGLRFTGARGVRAWAGLPGQPATATLWAVVHMGLVQRTAVMAAAQEPVRSRGHMAALSCIARAPSTCICSMVAASMVCCC